MKKTRYTLGAALLALLLAMPHGGSLAAAEDGRTADRDFLEEDKTGKFSVYFRGAHIRSVLRHLSEISGVNIVIDEAVLLDGGQILPGGISPRITLTIKDAPIMDILDIILRMKNLSYLIERNLIWISSPERLARERLETRIYHIASPVTGTVRFAMPDFETDREENGWERTRLRFPDR